MPRLFIKFSIAVKSLIYFFLFLFSSSVSYAQVLQQNEVKIINNQSKIWNFTAPAISSNQTVVLDFWARAWSYVDSTNGSYSYNLKIKVNGKEVNAVADRVFTRIRNRQSVENGKQLSIKYIGWKIKNSLDFYSSNNQVDEDCHYVIDLQDLLIPGTNTLEIQSRTAAGLSRDVNIKNVSIGVSTKQVATSALSIPNGAVTRFVVANDGSFSVEAGSLKVRLASSFSFPGGGWNRIGEKIVNRTAENQVSPSVTHSPNRYDMFFENNKYRVERTITFINAKAQFRDRIINKSGAELGMQVYNELGFPGLVKEMRIAGNDDPNIIGAGAPNEPLAQNPSIFIPLFGASIMMLAESDIYRAHATMVYDKRSYSDSVKNIPLRASMSDRILVIPANSEQTMIWSIYALGSNDYFDFVNRIRSDWQINVGLNSPIWWNMMNQADKSDEEVIAWAKSQSISNAVIGSWSLHNNAPCPGSTLPCEGLGVGVLDSYYNNYREELKNKIEKYHKEIPGMKISLYTHMFFNSPEIDQNQFSDSWITKADGKRLVINNSSVAPWYGVYPTSSNSFGRAYVSMISRLKNELDIDGIYFDETNTSSRIISATTYNRWDGVSAILDSTTFAIKNKIGLFPLLGRSFQDNLYNSLHDQGLWLLGNDQPWTASKPQTSFVRFNESDNLSNLFRSHLFGPFAFDHTYNDLEMEGIRERLELGAIYSVIGPGSNNEAMSKFFPITPRELHRGWVKGDERIITAYSGSYGWANNIYPVRIWQFDSNGLAIDKNPAWIAPQSSYQVRVPDGGVVVIEKKMNLASVAGFIENLSNKNDTVSVKFLAVNSSESSSSAVYNVNLGSDGYFKLDNVAAGKYKVIAIKSDGTIIASGVVDVGTQNIISLNLEQAFQSDDLYYFYDSSNKMANVLGIFNQSEEEKNAVVTLFNQNGNTLSSTEVNIKKRGSTDVLLNNLNSFNNNRGLVEVSFNGLNKRLDVYQAEYTIFNKSKKESELSKVFDSQLSFQGNTYAVVDGIATHVKTKKKINSQSLKQEWRLALANVGNSAVTFTINIFAQDSSLIAQLQNTISPFGTTYLNLADFTRSSTETALIEVIPSHPTERYRAELQLFSDRVGKKGAKIISKQQLRSATANTQTTIASKDGSKSSILLANSSNETANVRLALFNKQGTLIFAEEKQLAAHGQYKLNAFPFVNDSLIRVSLDSLNSKGLILTTSTRGYNKNKLSSGIERIAKIAEVAIKAAAFNFSNNTKNFLRIINLEGLTQNIIIRAYNQDGIFLGEKQLFLSPHSLNEFDLYYLDSLNASSSALGRIEVQSLSGKRFYAEIDRKAYSAKGKKLSLYGSLNLH